MPLFIWMQKIQKYKCKLKLAEFAPRISCKRMKVKNCKRRRTILNFGVLGFLKSKEVRPDKKRIPEWLFEEGYNQR